MTDEAFLYRWNRLLNSSGSFRVLQRGFFTCSKNVMVAIILATQCKKPYVYVLIYFTLVLNTKATTILAYLMHISHIYGLMATLLFYKTLTLITCSGSIVLLALILQAITPCAMQD